jgi:hypothetical protein
MSASPRFIVGDECKAGIGINVPYDDICVTASASLLNVFRKFVFRERANAVNELQL